MMYEKLAKDKKEELIKMVATRYSPYRSLVCLYAYSAWDRFKAKEK